MTLLRPFEWSWERQQELRACWARGLSMTQIARQLGVSKGMVSGKASRMELPPRKNIVRRVPAPQAITASPHQSITSSKPDTAPAKPCPYTMPPAPPRAPVERAPAPRPAPAPAPEPPASYRREPSAPLTCLWPLGDPGTPGFRLCGASRSFSRSYCDEHHATSRQQYQPPGVR